MRRWPLLLMMLFMAVAAASAPALDLPKEQAEQWREAQERYERNDYGGAAETLEGLLSERPDFAEAARLLGHARFELGEYEAARGAFLDAIAHGRITPAMMNRLLRIDRRREDTLGAIGSLQWLMLMQPEERQWRKLYAEQLRKLGAAERARGVYGRLAVAGPADADAHLALGNLLLEAGRMREAAAELETAWHLGRTSAALARTLGDLNQQMDQPGAALGWYDEALAASEEPSAQLRLRRARLLWRARRAEEAREAAAALAAEGGVDGEIVAGAHRLLGRIALEQEREDAAAEHWRRAVEAGMEDAQLLALLGSHHFNGGRFGRAAEYLERRLDVGGDDRTMRRYLVVALIESDQHERAAAQLRTYLEHHPLNDGTKRLIRRWREARGAGDGEGGAS